MAEREGFEPSEPVRVHSLSRGARSATLAPFHFTIPKTIMAERQGFEPWVTCATTVFKTVAFDHSAISPNIIYKVDKSLPYIYMFFYGSPNWIRTNDQTINSRLLYRWATGEYFIPKLYLGILYIFFIFFTDTLYIS